MAYTTIDKPKDYFNTVLWSGNNTSNSITGVGFQPDLVWIKERTSTSSHRLFNVIMGAGLSLSSNDSGSQTSVPNALTSFDSDGFTVDNDNGTNETGQTYVGWNWLGANGTASNTDGSITSTVSANTTAGFSIVSYTGTGSNATVGHGLSQEPDILIIKNRSVSNRWLVYTKLIDGTFDFLQLNTSDAKTNSSVTPFTSSVFSVINNADSGTSGNNYIAYAFHSVKAYSKMGIYTGNGSTDGTFIYTGFKPAFIITKASSTGQSWQLYDNKRNTFNQSSKILFPNLSASEQDDSSAAVIDILSNGFKQRVNDAGGNGSGHTYIYMAFAESPFVTSTGIPTTAR